MAHLATKNYLTSRASRDTSDLVSVGPTGQLSRFAFQRATLLNWHFLIIPAYLKGVSCSDFALN